MNFYWAVALLYPAILFFLLALIWGGSFIVIKFALESLNFIDAVLARVFVGFCFSLLLIMFRGRFKISSYRISKLPLRAIPAIFVVGCLAQAIPFLLLFKAETFISAGLAGILNGTVPLWTAVISMVFFAKLETFSAKNIMALIAGFIGMTLVCLPSLVSSDQHQSAGILGIALLMGVSVSYAVSALGAKVLKEKYTLNTINATFYYHAASLVFLIIFWFLFNQGNLSNFTQISSKSLLAILYLGILANGIAYLIFYYLVDKWGPTQATAVTYLIPAVAVALDFFVFKSMPHTLHIVGMGTILLSLLWMNNRKSNA